MIDLARKPSSTLDTPAPLSQAPSSPSYPTFYFNAPCDCDIPEEGTAVIKFRKIEETESTREANDPQYRYELEVQGIEIKGGKKDDDDMDAGMSMKRAMRKKMMEKLAEDND